MTLYSGALTKFYDLSKSDKNQSNALQCNAGTSLWQKELAIVARMSLWTRLSGEFEEKVTKSFSSLQEQN